METILRMTILDWLIFWLAIGAHAPLVAGILKTRKDKSQVFPTWILYFSLDLITMFSTVAKNGNYVILFGFSIGSFIMASILLYQRRINWTWLETVILLLVITCLLVWHYSGSLNAIIFGILSEIIVGIHLIIKTFMNPRVKYNLPGYIMFLIVSILSILNAKNLSIEEMGYAISETILSCIILIPLIKRWWILKIWVRNFA